MRGRFPLLSSAMTLVACVLFFSSVGLASEVVQIEVFEVVGKVEVLIPAPGARWRTVSPPFILKKGYKIRTASAGSAEIGFEPNLESAAHLEENSRLDVLSEQPLRLALERGQIFMIFEGESGNPPTAQPPHKLMTRDVRMELSRGAAAVKLNADGSVVRVFDESVMLIQRKEDSASGRKVEEGYQFFCGKKSQRAERMNYSDYTDWQAWIRKIYEKKDDRANA